MSIDRQRQRRCFNSIVATSRLRKGRLAAIRRLMSSPASTTEHVHEPSDVVGQVLSAVCAVHCVATPVVLSLLPAAGSVLGGAHPVLFLFVVVVAAWAFVRGYRCHRRLEVPALALTGVLLLGFAAFLLHGELVADSAVSLVGAGFMMAAHARNRTLLRASHHHASHHHSSRHHASRHHA